jgi:hypothetical protein
METDAASYLNSLPDSHWKQWYDQERRYNAALTEALSLGLSGEAAADYACRAIL